MATNRSEAAVAHVRVAESILDNNAGCDTTGRERPCGWACPSHSDLQRAHAHAQAAVELARGEREEVTAAATAVAERLRTHLHLGRADKEGPLRESLLSAPRQSLLGRSARPGHLRTPVRAPVARLVMAAGAQIALYRIDQLLAATPQGGWEGFHARLVGAVNAGLARAFNESKVADGSDLNFAHFAVQDAAFEALTADACYLGTALEELRGSDDYGMLRDALVAAGTDFDGRRLVRNDAEIKTPPHAHTSTKLLPPCAALQDSTGAEQSMQLAMRDTSGLAVSASSKRSGTGHDRHIHMFASVTGVYYASTPSGSSVITLDDGKEEVHFKPEPGDLLLFPSWLPHRVAESHFDQEPAAAARLHLSSVDRVSRVSFSFDLAGGWGY